MAVPVVAIVGRPNVGKSSLFNWLAGRRIAIVEPTAGVTRDRVAALIKSDNRFFELVDTGGMGIQDVDQLTAQVEQQIDRAIEEAHLILFIVDARTGMMPLDEKVARRLCDIGKPVLCVANKCDTSALEPQTAEFFKLVGRGFGKDVIRVSAQQGRGKKELLGQIFRYLPRLEAAPERAPTMKLAAVGRRNTGKSTFINCLAQSERMIVSEVPGTTRDSVDVRFERDGKAFIAIDTAGVRRRKSVRSSIEFYSLARAERSIRRADVVLLFFDARLRVSKTDKQLAGYILEHHKPAIFVINKWDLLKSQLPTGAMADYLRKVFPSLDFVPIAFITAKEGKNVHAVLNLAQNLHKQAGARVSTPDLNRVLRRALEEQAPPLRQNRRPKIFFGVQAAIYPPTIVLFTNGPELFDNTYQRYLLKTFRDQLPFHDVPIKLYLRQRRREERVEGEEEAVESAVRKPAKKRKKPARAAEAEAELWKD